MNSRDCKRIAELLKKIQGAMEQLESSATPQLPPIPPGITEEIFQSPAGFFSQLIVDWERKEVTVFISPPPSGAGIGIFRDC